METQQISCSSTQQCDGTIESSTPNTLTETTKPKSSNAKKTRSKPPVSAMNDSNESIDDDPPPFFLSNELHGVTFCMPEREQPFHTDDTSEIGVSAWTRKVEQVASVKGKINWQSLDERAHFLNKLFVFCAQKNLRFPFQVDTKLFPHLAEKI